jgi:hypothetical protein
MLLLLLLLLLRACYCLLTHTGSFLLSLSRVCVSVHMYAKQKPLTLRTAPQLTMLKYLQTSCDLKGCVTTAGSASVNQCDREE